MFVGHEVLLSVDFGVARVRFSDFIRGGWLGDASDRAHADGLSGLTRIGPFGAVLGASKLVRVQLAEPVPREDAVCVPLRWEATGVMGRLFPMFDADLMLTPGEAGTTRLALTGVYRAPLATVGSGLNRLVLHRAATAAVRSLLQTVAESVARPAPDPAVSTQNGAAGIPYRAAPYVDVEPEAWKRPCGVQAFGHGV